MIVFLAIDTFYQLFYVDYFKSLTLFNFFDSTVKSTEFRFGQVDFIFAPQKKLTTDH